jgi:hypothetical protein
MEYSNTEINDNYISIFKRFRIKSIPKLNKIDVNPPNNEWWKKEFLYDKYIKNKNLEWWELEFINNKYATTF